MLSLNGFNSHSQVRCRSLHPIKIPRRQNPFVFQIPKLKYKGSDSQIFPPPIPPRRWLNFHGVFGNAPSVGVRPLRPTGCCEALNILCRCGNSGMTHLSSQGNKQMWFPYRTNAIWMIPVWKNSNVQQGIRNFKSKYTKIQILAWL